MNVLTYLIGAAGLVGGLLVGWLLRHNVLKRHLSQSRKQLEEARSLHMTADHELSSLRQKLIQQTDRREKLSSAVKEAQSETQHTQEKLKQLDELENKVELVQEDNEVLQEQIAYLESEKISLQKNNAAVNDKLKHIKAENEQLRTIIKNLQAEKEKLKNIPRHHSSGIPRVHRVDPEEWKDLQKQQISEENQKDSTSRISQNKSTDRFKSKATQGETTGFQPKNTPQPELFPDTNLDADTDSELVPVPSIPTSQSIEPVQVVPDKFDPAPVEQKPDGPIQQEIPEPIIAHMPEPTPSFQHEPVSMPQFVPETNAPPKTEPVSEPELLPELDLFDESENLDEHLEGTDPGISLFEEFDDEPDENIDIEESSILETVQDEEVFPKPIAPPPPKPISKPGRIKSKRPNNWDPLSELNTGKKQKRTKKKKKKTPTVRTDITSSDIIDSFKKELGLPE